MPAAKIDPSDTPSSAPGLQKGPFNTAPRISSEAQECWGKEAETIGGIIGARREGGKQDSQGGGKRKKHDNFAILCNILQQK